MGSTNGDGDGRAKADQAAQRHFDQVERTADAIKRGIAERIAPTTPPPMSGAEHQVERSWLGLTPDERIAEVRGCGQKLHRPGPSGSHRCHGRPGVVDVTEKIFLGAIERVDGEAFAFVVAPGMSPEEIAAAIEAATSNARQGRRRSCSAARLFGLPDETKAEETKAAQKPVVPRDWLFP